MKLIDLTGRRFGRLVVIERDFEYQKNQKYARPYWKCRCDCGNIVTILGKSLREGKTKSCGCYSRDQAKSLQFRDITNQKFGLLTAIKYLGNGKWECLCDCGNLSIVTTNHLTSGHTLSCGHLRSKNKLIIKTFLTNNKIKYISEYAHNDLRNSYGHKIRMDFALIDKENKPYLFIEFNGNQHYDKTDAWYSDVIADGDNCKQKYAKEVNIPLIILNNNSDLSMELNKIKEFVFSRIDFSNYGSV